MDIKLELEAARLFDKGKLLKEISLAIGKSQGRVSEALHKHGRSAWNRRYPDAKGFDVTRIVADYQAGMRLDEILKKHKVSQTTLYRYINRAGIPLRPRPGNWGKDNFQYKHGEGNRTKKRKPQLTKMVASACLGYVIPHGWIIHHRNEDPQDNRPENLAIFHSRSEHAKYHQWLLRFQRAGLPYDANHLVSRNGGFLLPTPTHPILLEHEKGRLDPPGTQEMPKKNPE